MTTRYNKKYRIIWYDRRRGQKHRRSRECWGAKWAINWLKGLKAWGVHQVKMYSYPPPYKGSSKKVSPAYIAWKKKGGHTKAFKQAKWESVDRAINRLS